MRPDTAWLLGNYFGSAIWGVYSALFFLTLWTIGRQGRFRFRSPVICGMIVLYVVNIGYTAFLAAASYEAFIAADGDANSYIGSRQGYNTIVVHDFVSFISTVITDSTLAWRVYIIYLRNNRILAGILTILMGTFVSGIGALILDMLIVVHGPTPKLVYLNNAFGVAVVSLAIAFNWAVTGLIVSKLWWADKRMKNTSVLSHYDGVAATPVTRIYQKVTIVLIESGTLYSVVWLIWIVTYTMGEAGANVPLLLVPINPRVMGLIPTLIVLQRSLGYIQTSESPVPNASTRVEFAAMSTGQSSDLRSKTGIPVDEYNLGIELPDRNAWNESSTSGLAPTTCSEISRKS